MKENRAVCTCGQLSLTFKGEITKTSVCHCFECQKRTGSSFGYQTRLDKKSAVIKGQSTKYRRQGDSGGFATMHFCPTCGSTVFWEPDAMPEVIVVAAGNLTDSSLPAPEYMVYGNRAHKWIKMPESTVEYFD